MSPKIFRSNLFRKTIISIVFTLAIAFLSVSIAFAALFAINTNNNSASDWAGVDKLLPDDGVGDYPLDEECTDGSGMDDIIESYVASGPPGANPEDPPTHIYFRVKTASGGESQQFHQVGAYMDCLPDGQDVNDAVVVYRGYRDEVILGDGHLNVDGIIAPYCYALYDGPEGERPADALDTIEWGVPFVDFNGLNSPPYCDPNYIPNCGPDTEAKIKFFTYRVNIAGIYQCTYDETDWYGFNIPTAIEVNSLSARLSQDPGLTLGISLAGFFVAVIMAGVGIRLVRKG